MRGIGRSTPSSSVFANKEGGGREGGEAFFALTSFRSFPRRHPLTLQSLSGIEEKEEEEERGPSLLLIVPPSLSLSPSFRGIYRLCVNKESASDVSRGEGGDAIGWGKEEGSSTTTESLFFLENFFAPFFANLERAAADPSAPQPDRAPFERVGQVDGMRKDIFLGFSPLSGKCTTRRCGKG